MTQKTNPSDDQIHPIAKYFLWLDKPLARKLPLVIFGVLTLLFLSYDFIVHRHG